jgi:hypothetical protein
MFKKLFCNADGKVSFTKIGGWIFSVAGYISLAEGVPSNIRVIAGAIASIGAATGIAGARDAVDKK